MNISMASYNNNDYWLLKDNAVTSSVSSKGISKESISSFDQKNFFPLDENRPASPSSIVHLSGKRPESESDKIGTTKIDTTEGTAGTERAAGTAEEGTAPDSEKSEKSAVKSQTQEINNKELSEEDLRQLDELQAADTEVRAHEMAHIAAGGQYITSGAQLDYRKGPDGKRYAVAGEVSIDTSPISGDPEATVAKMRQVQRAALAPASPSGQDRKVASSAGSLASQALSEMIVEQSKNRVQENEEKAFGDIQNQDSKSKTTETSSNQPISNTSKPVENIETRNISTTNRASESLKTNITPFEPIQNKNSADDAKAAQASSNKESDRASYRNNVISIRSVADRYARISNMPAEESQFNRFMIAV